MYMYVCCIVPLVIIVTHMYARDSDCTSCTVHIYMYMHVKLYAIRIAFMYTVQCIMLAAARVCNYESLPYPYTYLGHVHVP